MHQVISREPLWSILETEGRTQAWLARRTAEILRREKAIDPAQLCRWVQGLHVPEKATREAIAHALCRQVESIEFGVRRPERDVRAAA